MLSADHKWKCRLVARVNKTGWTEVLKLLNFLNVKEMPIKLQFCANFNAILNTKLRPKVLKEKVGSNLILTFFCTYPILALEVE